MSDELPPFPWMTPRLHRLEWTRFLIAGSMVVTAVAEAALAMLVGWYNLPVWVVIIGVEWFALHRMTQVISRERKIASDAWFAEFDRRVRGL